MSMLEFADSCSLTGDPPGFVYGLNMRSEPAAGQTGTFWDAVRDFDFVTCFNILFCSISCECSSVRLTVFRIRLKSFNGHPVFRAVCGRRLVACPCWRKKDGQWIEKLMSLSLEGQ